MSQAQRPADASPIEVDFVIDFQLEGFPVQAAIRGGTADQLQRVIGRLKQIGATPPTATPATAPATPQARQEPPAAARPPGRSSPVLKPSPAPAPQRPAPTRQNSGRS